MFEKKYALLTFLFVVSGVFPDSLAAWTRDDSGIQRVHQDKVPQMTKTGGIQYSYNSNSFFPLGIYYVDPGPVTDASSKPQSQPWTIFGNNATSSKNRVPQVKAAGFNTAIRFITFGPGVEDGRSDLIPNQAEFNLVNQNNLKIFVSVYKEAVLAANNAQGRNYDTLKNLILNIKGNSSIIGYSLFDEVEDRYPATLPMDNAKWQRVYETIKSADPARIIYANANGLRGSVRNRPPSAQSWKYDIWSDLAGFDRYSKKLSNIYNGEYMDLVDLGKITSSYVNDTRPTFVVFQAYGRPDVDPSPGDQGARNPPTPEELRAEYYTSIVRGATAIGLFTMHSCYTPNAGCRWDSVKGPGYTLLSPELTPELWSAAAQANKEIEKWKSVFLSKTSRVEYHVDYDTNPGGVSSLLKDPGDGSLYLLAVSENVPGDVLARHTVRFAFPGTSRISKVTDLFSNIVVPVTNNSFANSVKRNYIHFYKIDFDPNSTPPPTPSPTPTGTRNPGDINNDNAANVVDIGLVIDNYNPRPNNYPKSDINNDGVVNILDIGIIVDNYTR